MSHEAHPNPNLTDDPTTGPVVVYGAVGTLFFVVLMIVLAAIYFQVARDYSAEESRVLPSQTTVGMLHSDQEAILNTDARWIDKANGVVGITIDDAMKVVAREMQKGGSGLPKREPQAAPSSKPTSNPASEP